MTYEEIVEKVAKAWASMDGKAEEYEEGKKGFVEDLNSGGHYMGYMEEAKELLKRSDLERTLKVVSKVITHLNAEKNGAYFICGEGGEKNDIGIPKKLYICPTFGLDWSYVYERTDQTSGPEW